MWSQDERELVCNYFRTSISGSSLPGMHVSTVIEQPVDEDVFCCGEVEVDLEIEIDFVRTLITVYSKEMPIARQFLSVVWLVMVMHVAKLCILGL